jgi:hypothetical protein
MAVAASFVRSELAIGCKASSKTVMLVYLLKLSGSTAYLMYDALRLLLLLIFRAWAEAAAASVFVTFHLNETFLFTFAAICEEESEGVALRCRILVAGSGLNDKL